MMTGVFPFAMDRFKFNKGFQNMKTMTKFLAATAVALTMGAASVAQAAIFVSFNGVTSLVPGGLLLDGNGSFFKALGPNGGFEGISVTGDTGVLPAVLHTQTFQFNNSAGGFAATKVYITQTDITAPFKSFYSTFSGNAARGFGGTITAYVDTANGSFNTSTAIGSINLATCGATSCAISGDATSGQFALPNAPYAITHVYDVFTNNGGTSSPSAITNVAIPEPGTWALMIMGFGGAGAMLRRSRRVAVA